MCNYHSIYINPVILFYIIFLWIGKISHDKRCICVFWWKLAALVRQLENRSRDHPKANKFLFLYKRLS